MSRSPRDAWCLAFVFLFWGLLFAIVSRPVTPLPPPPLEAEVPRAAGQVALVVLEGVPDEAFSWPALVPFFEDVLRRGCGGRLSGTAAPLTGGALPARFPYGPGEEDLVGLLRRAGRRVLGTGTAPARVESIVPWAGSERDLGLALDEHFWNLIVGSLRIAPGLDGALEVDGVATPRARAILDEDRRCARIAGLLGSGGPVILVYGSEGQGYRWAAAGPGIRPDPGESVVSPQALVGTVAAVLGLRPPLADGASSPPIVDFPTLDASRRIAASWQSAQRRRDHDQRLRAVSEQRRHTTMVLVLLGWGLSVVLILGIRFLD